MKVCAVEAFVRNADNEIVTVDNVQGTTADDGVTVVIPIGFLPNISRCAPADIKVTVFPKPAETQPAALVSRVDDPIAAISTLKFNLRP